MSTARTAAGVVPMSKNIVDEAIASGGDLVIKFPHRIGATPYARFTPYINNDGVRCHHWTIIAVSLRAMPGRTLINRPRVIEASETDYPLRHFSTPSIRREVRISRAAELVLAEETPFAGDAWAGWCQNE